MRDTVKKAHRRGSNPCFLSIEASDLPLKPLGYYREPPWAVKTVIIWNDYTTKHHRKKRRLMRLTYSSMTQNLGSWYLNLQYLVLLKSSRLKCVVEEIVKIWGKQIRDGRRLIFVSSSCLLYELKKKQHKFLSKFQGFLENAE